MTYQECVEYILSIPLFAAKLGTDNLNQILDIMNHPERNCPVIHVAGTNGKGSTCLFLSSVLEKTGYRVGVFTSPHLVRINERIRINDSIISDEDFVDVFEEVMDCILAAQKQGIAHPSFFEFVFLMACIYFKKQQVDYAVFETGMGGRLDATNVVEPALCIITSIGLDHMQFLGDTIEQIAGEKAGIIKNGVPVLYFDRKDAATAVIRDYAAKTGSKLQLVEKKQYKILKITEKTIDFLFDSGYYRYSSLQIRKTGLYQIENAILAVKAYELLFNMTYRCCDWQSGSESEQGTPGTDCLTGTDTGYRLTDIYDNIRAGLLSMTWPCRMQEVSPHIYIDGAHNEEAIEAFCQTLEELFRQERKILLFAVSKDKDYEPMIQRLSRIFFEEIIIVRYDGDRAADLSVVEAAFRRFSGSKITVYDNIRAGFTYAKSHVDEQYLFCVGSLYLAGDLLALGV
ncbi:MAG: bifunctional folylpolyglutamate synthase/dihydrofolate synthase [Clostridium sp.]|nr:bifunctional folylpolyglutamate synthase/dihydrofolate synthase [Clostridium sp.]